MMPEDSLEGIRVLLIGHVWAGPMCAALFSDMGAEVIRLESRTRVDGYRILFAKDKGNLEQGPFYQVLNRNALSVTLDMRQPKARELAKAIIAVSDVLLENNVPTTLKNWGLDYPSVRQVNPEIIMASISGYGQNGPLSRQGAYGPTTAALAGLSSLVGYESEEPVGLLTAYGDPVAGLGAFLATMAALHYRYRTGKGQYIDISQWEALDVMMAEQILDYQMNGRVASCKGNSSEWMAPHGCYRCKGEDKWITIACATQGEWEALCQVTRHPQWLKDKRFVDMCARLKNRKALNKAVEEWTANHDNYEVMEMLQNAGVAGTPVLSLAELFTDPQTQEEDYFLHLSHPEQPGGYVYNTPWKLSDTPGKVRRHAPLMGEHNEYVLCDLCGIPKDEFQRLVEEKVIW